MGARDCMMNDEILGFGRGQGNRFYITTHFTSAYTNASVQWYKTVCIDALGWKDRVLMPINQQPGWVRNKTVKTEHVEEKRREAWWNPRNAEIELERPTIGEGSGQCMACLENIVKDSIRCNPMIDFVTDDLRDRDDLDEIDRQFDIRVNAVDKGGFMDEVLNCFAKNAAKRRERGEITLFDDYEGGLPQVVEESTIVIVPPNYFAEKEKKKNKKKKSSKKRKVESWADNFGITRSGRKRREHNSSTQPKANPWTSKREEDVEPICCLGEMDVLQIDISFGRRLTSMLKRAGTEGRKLMLKDGDFGFLKNTCLSQRTLRDTLWDLVNRGEVFRIFGWDHIRFVHKNFAKYYHIPLCRITLEHAKWDEIMSNFWKKKEDGEGRVKKKDEMNRDEQGKETHVKVEPTLQSQPKHTDTPKPAEPEAEEGRRKRGSKRKRRNQQDEKEKLDEENRCEVEFCQDFTKSLLSTPWAHLMSDIADDLIEDLASGIAWIVATNPGISLMAVHKKYERIVTPAQLLFLCHVFEDNGILKIREIKVEESLLFEDLFNEPSGGQEKKEETRYHLFSQFLGNLNPEGNSRTEFRVRNRLKFNRI